MFVATGNRLEGQTLYSIGLQHAAHSQGDNCVHTIKIHNNLHGQIYHCYLFTYSPQSNPNNGMAHCHKKAVDTCCTATVVQLLDSKNIFSDLY